MTTSEETGSLIDMQAIPVHITSSEATLVTEVSDFVFTFLTWSVGTTPIQIAQEDPTRETVMILPIDGAIVLTSSYGQASMPANIVAGVPNPIGAYIPQGTAVSLDGTDNFWAVAPATTRITMITTRRRAAL